MQYRIFLASLFVLIIFAYMDTAAIMSSFYEKNLFEEYQISDKFLGIGVKTTDSNTVKIVKVVNNTPAEKSGLVVGDVILRVENKDVSSAEGFKNDIDSLPKGRKISLTILKSNEQKLKTLSLLSDNVQR